ncbi:hypothetical protein EDD16DRAFT_1474105 [Pisolithus croceorrhizus]|nr:hypothetical protein EV401DRAFT_2266874 [Pisolithus croceorrhizus]KAI6125661.1 hypothetical protein EDD16DRAFT_1474105 [Pisolithus croceorrhizus]KAI6148244.1 hypothetical protein EDD17DRAFT_1493638 [Pisolithus thermaeus]
MFVQCRIRFAIRSRRLMDAYHKGLNGRQAASATGKYRGHCVLPVSIMNELEGCSNTLIVW